MPDKDLYQLIEKEKKFTDVDLDQYIKEFISNSLKEQLKEARSEEQKKRIKSQIDDFNKKVEDIDQKHKDFEEKKQSYNIDPCPYHKILIEFANEIRAPALWKSLKDLRNKLSYQDGHDNALHLSIEKKRADLVAILVPLMTKKQLEIYGERGLPPLQLSRFLSMGLDEKDHAYLVTKTIEQTTKPYNSSFYEAIQMDKIEIYQKSLLNSKLVMEDLEQYREHLDTGLHLAIFKKKFDIAKKNYVSDKEAVRPLVYFRGGCNFISKMA
jgi:hypothetical protein